MLQWQLVFLFLLAEVFVCIVVVLPLPLKFRKSILQSIDSLTSHKNISIILKVIFLLLLLLFVDCIRSSIKVEDKLEHLEEEHGRSRHSTSHCEDLNRLFRNQRNAYENIIHIIYLFNFICLFHHVYHNFSYLTGFALFLFLMIYRLKEMMMSLISLERKGHAVVSQASNSQKEYTRLSEERDKFKSEAESARKLAKTLEDEAVKLRSSEKAIKQQADNQQKECIFSFI